MLDLTADDVNERFRELIGDEFSVKDLRTWHATVRAAQAFAAPPKPTKRAVSAVMKDVAEHLRTRRQTIRRFPFWCLSI